MLTDSKQAAIDFPLFWLSTEEAWETTVIYTFLYPFKSVLPPLSTNLMPGCTNTFLNMLTAVQK